MALNKVTYIARTTPVSSQNLNDIQDAVIELQNKALITDAQSLTDAEIAQVKKNIGVDTGVKYFSGINIIANSSRTYTFPASARGMFMIIGSVSVTGLFGVYTSSNGTAYVRNLVAASGITTSVSGSSVTFNNTTSANAYVLYIGTNTEEITVV